MREDGGRWGSKMGVGPADFVYNQLVINIVVCNEKKTISNRNRKARPK